MKIVAPYLGKILDPPLLEFASVNLCMCTTASVSVRRVRRVLTCADCDSVMCLLIGRSWGVGGGGCQHRASWELSKGLVNYCHSVISHPPVSTIPTSHIPTAKQRQRHPLQRIQRGPSLHEYLTSATASFCLTYFPLLCYLSRSPSLSSSSPFLHQSISGYFVSQLYRELLLMTTITVVYFLSTAQPLYACRASITLWYSSALY